MKKRLFKILLVSFTAFFLFLYIIFCLINNIKLLENPSNVIFLLTIAIVVNIFISMIMTEVIIKESIKPLDQFINYISQIILNDPSVKRLEEDQEQEVYNMLINHGYDAQQIEEGLKALLYNYNARREFSANVSHELKSPLTSINGFAEMIAAGIATGEEARDFANRINKEGNRLLKMIDQTIQLSKIDNNYIKSESLSNFDIGSIIEENVESYELQAKEKGMKINFDYREVNYFGNSRLIFDLVRNLISNAIKYRSSHNPYLNIRIREKEDKIVLVFDDNGIGISKDDQIRIFERFYVVDKSRGNKTGTGLGLSLVKNIVQFHKGSILLESELDIGSKFEISLPKLKKEDFD